MVSPEIIYLEFLNKINRGNSQGDIACDKDRFVLIFNEVKNRWVEKTLKVKDSILIDSLWEIVKTKTFTSGVDKNYYIEFQIPIDFYELILSILPIFSYDIESKSGLGVIEFASEKNFRSNCLQQFSLGKFCIFFTRTPWLHHRWTKMKLVKYFY